MRYLSIDLEATGLEQDAYLIEFAAIPFDTEALELNHSLSFHCHVQCPSFEQLKPHLNPWVIEHNRTLIETAHLRGLSIPQFKEKLTHYLENQTLSQYLSAPPYTLFGKSLSALDLPLLRRDLGGDFLKKYFVHRQLDLSSYVYALVDMGCLDSSLIAGSELMKYVGMGDVAHTAMEDAVNTAKIYFELLKKFSPKRAHPSVSSPQN